MKYIKLYESYKDIDTVCKKYGIINYTINLDSTVDVDDDITFYKKYLSKLPLKFGNVSGNFSCRNNELTTLEGCPKSIGGNFDYGYNHLTTLEGGPQSVGGYFDCGNNKLTSLEGCAKSIGGGFYFDNNKLKDLYGFPEFFDNGIYYSNNPVREILDLFDDRLGKVIDLLNEYCVIQQDGKVVILDRLEEVFHTLSMEIPEEIKLKNYEVY